MLFKRVFIELEGKMVPQSTQSVGMAENGETREVREQNGRDMEEFASGDKEHSVLAHSIEPLWLLTLLEGGE